jgi:hypothetical protein
LKQEVRVTPTWQRFTITGVATEGDENAGLYLAFGGNGALWIDNVSAASDKPATAGGTASN